MMILLIKSLSSPNFEIFLYSSVDMHCCHLTEMKAHDCKSDCLGEQTGTFEQGPEKEPPIMGAFDAANAEMIN